MNLNSRVSLYLAKELKEKKGMWAYFNEKELFATKEELLASL